MEIGGWQHFIYFSFYHFNPQKCKEMAVNFMGNPNTMMRPLHIGNQMVERISSYNLLAVIINENWKWNCHVDYITSKASKKLYALRLLKRAGVQEQQEQVFRSSVRQILEYAVQVCGKTFLTICKGRPGFLGIRYTGAF